jgi:hypothetical protein
MRQLAIDGPASLPARAPGGGTAAAGCLAYAAATLIFSLILLKLRSCRLEEAGRNAYFSSIYRRLA